MKCQIPQISWHGRDPVLSVDFQFSEGEVRRLATGGTDAHVVIWYVTICSNNTINIDCACQLARHNKSVNVVRFSPGGEFLASGDDEGGIFIWKLKETNQPDFDCEESEGDKENWFPFKLLRRHLDDICDLNWSPNSEYLISGSIDNCIVIWDISKGQCNFSSKDAKGFVQGVAWDPLNKYFASMSSDRMLRIYKETHNKIIHRIHKAPPSENTEKSVNKSNKLFHDDTLQSFSRRLNFSPDGKLLFVPSGIKEKEEKLIHTTYAFSRYDFSQPAFHFPTGQKYTVAVRCCPLLFTLRECKNTKQSVPLINLPYRILIAVATQDSIYLYDTQQQMPFAYVSNIHYAHLTDMTWSSDARMLIASSTDGYCSFIIFNEGELGEVYIQPPEEPAPLPSTESSHTIDTLFKSDLEKTSSPSVEKILPSLQTDDSDIVKSPRKSKTPKKVCNSSEKKTVTPVHKRCSRSITSFFSPPSKKAKPSESSNKDDDDDILVISVLPSASESAVEEESKNIAMSLTSEQKCATKISPPTKPILIKGPDLKAEKDISGITADEKNLCSISECNENNECLVLNNEEEKSNSGLQCAAKLPEGVVAETMEVDVLTSSTDTSEDKNPSDQSEITTEKCKKSVPEETSQIDQKPVPEETSQSDQKPVPEETSQSHQKPVPEQTSQSDSNPTDKMPAHQDLENKPKRRIQLITLSK